MDAELKSKLQATLDSGVVRGPEDVELSFHLITGLLGKAEVEYLVLALVYALRIQGKSWGPVDVPWMRDQVAQGNGVLTKLLANPFVDALGGADPKYTTELRKGEAHTLELTEEAIRLLTLRSRDLALARCALRVMHTFRPEYEGHFPALLRLSATLDEGAGTQDGGWVQRAISGEFDAVACLRAQLC